MFGSRHSCLEFRFRVWVWTLSYVLSYFVSVRSRVCSAVRSSVHVCFVVLHAVRVFIVFLACVFHWLPVFMLSVSCGGGVTV